MKLLGNILGTLVGLKREKRTAARVVFWVGCATTAMVLLVCPTQHYRQYSGNRHYSMHCHTCYSHLCQASSHVRWRAADTAQPALSVEGPLLLCCKEQRVIDLAKTVPGT